MSPFTALERRGYPCGWDFRSSPGLGAVATAFDGFVLARLGWSIDTRPEAARWFRMLREVGKLAVFEADDDVFSPPMVERTLALGMAGGRSREQLDASRRELIWVVEQCDGVTVSTRRLATVVRQLTDRPVVVVPNAIDLPWFRRVLATARRRTPGVTIGWAGGIRPDRDVAAMAEGWRRVAAAEPRVTFVIQGYVPPVLAAAVPSERLLVLPWMPLERYPAGLVEIDIGCAAVSDTPFDRCKSVIKAWEYAAAGAAVVATPTLYAETVEHGVTGYLAETADAWEAALRELVSRPALRAMMARRLLRRVEREHALAVNLWRWPAAWAEIAESAKTGKLVAV